jgi:DNA-binding beta-propeller fold protein YncE
MNAPRYETHEEGRMRGPYRVQTTAFAAALVALLGARGATQTATDPATRNLPNPYQAERNWGTLPDGRVWGSTAGIGIGPDGHIWVIDRCGGNSCAGSNVAPIVKLDRTTGKPLASFGAGQFIFPHGLHVDRDGNVWVTDGRAANAEELAKSPAAKGKGHTVVKFSPDGRVLLTLGRPGIAASGRDTLSEPCDVITAPNGEIFVADGHSGQNPAAPADTVARIVKFSRDGKYIKEWGTLGSAPGEFRTPHALAFDSRGRLIVADRGNMRLQFFDQDGKFLSETKEFSRVSGLFVDRNDTLYAIDSETNATNHPGWRKGVRIGSLKDLKVQFFIPPHQTDRPEGAAGEGVAVDGDGNVYGAEVTVRGLTKYVRRAGTP